MSRISTVSLLILRCTCQTATSFARYQRDVLWLEVQITVVDSHTFIQEYACRNPTATRPDLGGDQSLFRPVVDLLVEQVETADYVLLNKVDLLGQEKIPELEAIIRSINPLCQAVPCSHGQVFCCCIMNAHRSTGVPVAVVACTI
jgi:G3E family GTPase